MQLQDVIEEIDQKVDLGDELHNQISDKLSTLETLKDDTETSVENLRDSLSQLRDIEHQIDELDRVINEASDSFDIEV